MNRFCSDPLCIRWLVACLLVVVAAPALGDSVALHQMDFQLDGNAYTNTEWGVTFMGYSSSQYMNLVVDGEWVLENMPLQSPLGPGVSNTVRYYFDLGVARGTEVTSAQYDYAISDAPLGSAPGGAIVTTIDDGSSEFFNGLIDIPISGDLASAGNLVGGLIESNHIHWGFIPMEQERNACTPTAVRQSLKWLKEKKNLPIPDNAITDPNVAKTMTGWTEAGGCRGDKSDPNAWYKLKEAATKQWGVTTTVKHFDTATEAGRRALMDWLCEQMDDDQDIELDITGHTTSLVGICKLAGGRYGLMTADDAKQGQAGGRLYVGDIYDPATNMLNNVPFLGVDPGFADAKLYNAVVECPEPSTVALLALSAIALVRRRGR